MIQKTLNPWRRLRTVAGRDFFLCGVYDILMPIYAVTEAEGMQFYADISTDSLDWYRNIYIKEAIKTWILHVADVFSDMDIVLKQTYPCIVGDKTTRKLHYRAVKTDYTAADVPDNSGSIFSWYLQL